MVSVHSKGNMNDFVEQLKKELKVHLENSIVKFLDAMSALFAYTVLVEGDNGLSDEPLNIDSFKELEELLSSRWLIGVDMSDWSVKDWGISIPKDSFEVVTWKDYFIGVINNYVKDSFMDMLVSNSSKYSHLLEDYFGLRGLGSKEHGDKVFSILSDVIGEDYFKLCSEDLQTILFGLNPRSIYERGKEKAESMLEDAKSRLKKLENDFIELSESIVRVNKLWDKLSVMYENEYKEKIPRGMVSKEIYETRLKVLFNKLKDEGVPVEDIRELAMLDTRFSIDMIRDLLNFNYQ